MVLIGDVSCAFAASCVAFALRFGPPQRFDEYVVLTLLLPVAWSIIIALNRGYELRFLGTGPEECRRILHAGLLGFAFIAVTSYAFRSEVARGYVFVTVPLALVLTIGARRRLRRWIYRLRSRGLALQRVLVIGRADAALALIEQLEREPQHGLAPIGAVVPSSTLEGSQRLTLPVVGDPASVLRAVDETQAHVVAVVSHPDISGQALRRLSWALEDRSVELIVSPGIVEVAGPRLSIRPVAGLSLLHLERPSASGGRLIGKLVFDLVAAAVLLMLATPAMLVIAALIRVTSPGPAIYRQTRIGAAGREFTILKFRSMVVGAHERLPELLTDNEASGWLFKLRKDPRVTPLGAVLRRYSLDELPQLLNVLRGDMSLVGPRPPLPREVASYNEDAVRRLRVRPGLTGLWQVNGRTELTAEESLRLDLRYVDNWSLALDLSILWRTVRAVVKGIGAY